LNITARWSVVQVVFSSVVFIFAFMPVFYGLYYLVPFQYRSWIIVVLSYSFYGWWRIDFLGLLILVTFSNYYFGNRIRLSADQRGRRFWLALAIILDLSVLGYFKYWNFFVDSLADLVNGGQQFPMLWAQVILPIGISFYVFQAISYVMDVYRGDALTAKRLIDFAAFKAMFPQLVAGPVIRYKDIEEQFTKREMSWSLFGYGALRFMSGLAKKVIIADSVAPIADAVFAAPNPTMAEAWLGTVAYAIQLYFDFSAYSSMAIGLALMMGFRFVENFRFPYISRSITEFWRRWHISLSSWLRDYLYIPLGGNRKGVGRTYFNLMLTMILGGFWHGANWTFLLWGLLHGSLLALERAAGVSAAAPRPFWAWPLTIGIVLVGWVLFRAPELSVALDVYAGMLGLQGFGIRTSIAWQISHMAVFFLVVGVALALLERPLNRLFGLEAISEPLVKEQLGPVPLVGTLTVVFLGVVAITKLLADNDSPFLYFQF
jgi:alginate O-acetyltransferase complex protein AlgI